jgi:hypothetical protein
MAVKFDNNKHWTSIVCCRAGCTLSADGTAFRTSSALALTPFDITAARRLETGFFFFRYAANKSRTQQ